MQGTTLIGAGTKCYYTHTHTYSRRSCAIFIKAILMPPKNDRSTHCIRYKHDYNGRLHGEQPRGEKKKPDKLNYMPYTLYEMTLLNGMLAIDLIFATNCLTDFSNKQPKWKKSRRLFHVVRSDTLTHQQWELRNCKAYDHNLFLVYHKSNKKNIRLEKYPSVWMHWHNNRFLPWSVRVFSMFISRIKCRTPKLIIKYHVVYVCLPLFGFSFSL